MTGCGLLPDSIQAVVFDLDDTLLRDDRTISDFTIQVMRDISVHGIKVIPASGRTQKSMLPFIDQLGCVSIYIAKNGADIWDNSSGKLLHQELFSVSLAREIAAFGRSYGVYTQTYDNERFYYSVHSHWADSYAASAMIEGQYVGDLERFIKEPRNKILMMDDESVISDMYDDASTRFKGRVSVTRSKPFFLEFNPINATKGNALRIVSDLVGIPMSGIVAFGDSLNDLSMLSAAGLSVAVANAWPEVIAECDDKCLSNNDDGVAFYLKELLLSGE